MKQILTMLIFISTYAFGQAKIYTFTDNGSGKLDEQTYYGSPIHYSSKPVFIVVNKPVSLPILSFNAEKKDNYVLLTWIASYTVNVERSGDALRYTTIAKNLNDKKLIDLSPLEGVNYYRLKTPTGYSQIRRIDFHFQKPKMAVFTVIGEYLGETNDIKEFMLSHPRARWYIVVSSNGNAQKYFNQ